MASRSLEEGQTDSALLKTLALLSAPAIKLARRLQCLPTNRCYIIVLRKRERGWEWFIPDSQGAKLEEG